MNQNKIQSSLLTNKIKEQLLKQQYEQYQHSDGTCYCSLCLCGNCKCKPKPLLQKYDPNIKSIYAADFNPKQSNIHNQFHIKPGRTYERKKALSMHSVYEEDYVKQPIETQIRERTNSQINAIPFAGASSYAIQYPNKVPHPPAVIKPLNQIQLLPVKLDAHSQYQREYQRKQSHQDQFANFSKIMNKRLHVNSKDKMVFINSSYHDSYKKQSIERVRRLPVQPSILPFGLSNQGLNIFNSVNHQDYSQKQPKKCEAETKLDSLAEQMI